MPKSKELGPRLVAVAEIPKSTRRSIYVDLVDEFVRSDLQNAKIEGIKLSAAISVKKAIASLGLKNVTAVTVNSEVYLSRRSDRQLEAEPSSSSHGRSGSMLSSSIGSSSVRRWWRGRSTSNLASSLNTASAAIAEAVKPMSKPSVRKIEAWIVLRTCGSAPTDFIAPPGADFDDRGGRVSQHRAPAAAAARSLHSRRFASQPSPAKARIHRGTLLRRSAPR